VGTDGKRAAAAPAADLLLISGKASDVFANDMHRDQGCDHTVSGAGEVASNNKRGAAGVSVGGCKDQGLTEDKKCLG
jgi:hypothetical protein